ncbi:MAG: protein-glutamate O-methyltransferase [Chloroflexi bacterium]|nr:protein-glutamate O-methyltransferase [Chloroflexota bacterium]
MSEPRLTDADYLRFRDLARQKTGLEFGEVRRPDLERAIFSTLRLVGLPDSEALFHLLTDSPNGQTGLALDALVAGLTVGETHFFRNRPQFAALERTILPDLIARRRATRRLRIWSAGCATGEEPYSLAILLQRLLPDLADWNITLLATDLNRQALEKARRGVYGAWSFREVPPEIQANYFIQHGRESEITPATRNLVTFAHLNLVEDTYPALANNTADMDLILCRNVLIYFNEATTRGVVGRLYGSLAAGGWLVVGHAEPSQSIFSEFHTQNFPGTVIYQRHNGVGKSPMPSPTFLPAVAPPLQREHPERNGAFLRSAVEGCGQCAKTAPPPSTTPAKINGLRSGCSAAERPAIKPALAAAPASSEAEIEAALALWKGGQQAEALRRLEAAGRAYPQDGRPAYLAARFYANQLQLEAAETQIKLALERAPLLAPAHYLHGMILQEQGRFEEALAAIRRCVYTDSRFVLGQYALATLLDRLGQATRAATVRETVLNLLERYQPGDPLPDGDGLTAGRLLEMVKNQ